MDTMQAIRAMEVISLENVFLQGVLGANRDDGLGSLQGLKPLGLA